MLDVGQVTVGTALDYAYAETVEPPMQAWVRERVEGVWAQREQLDAQLQQHLKNWSWDRVGRVERSLLRLALYEMLHWGEELPFSAAISEAVELAKEYADEKSAPFINGVLDGVWRAHSGGGAAGEAG